MDKKFGTLLSSKNAVVRVEEYAYLADVNELIGGNSETYKNVRFALLAYQDESNPEIVWHSVFINGKLVLTGELLKDKVEDCKGPLREDGLEEFCVPLCTEWD